MKPSAILDKLDQFTDYDLMLTTPIPAIRDRFLTRFDPGRSACFLAANVGRDVLPFLQLLAFADLSIYQHFIKIHTKRSSHLSNGDKWFSRNVEVLIGDKRMTERIFDLIDPSRPGIYGLECKPLRDHYRSNRHWLKFLLPDRHCYSNARFIPGTMFAGSAEFLRRLAALNLHLHHFEGERGQLDGCLIHALERYFGYFARAGGGECATFTSLISGNRSFQNRSGSL
jgi:lipopolysaccharide biosynthesis protein